MARKLIAAVALVTGLSCFAQTQLNPVTQVNWSRLAGSAAPTSSSPGFCGNTTTASAVAGSAVVTVASTSGILPSQTVTGGGIAANTTVLAVNAVAGTITLSQTVTISPEILTFYALGMPYLDTAHSANYSCGTSGWFNNTSSGLPIAGGTMTSPGNITSPGNFYTAGLPTGYNYLYTFGDSLTQGSEGINIGSYPGYLGPNINYSTYNLGVDAQLSSQIAARMGAVPSQQTFASGFTLPTATMTAVNVSFPSGYEPAYNLYNAPTFCTTGTPAIFTQATAGNGNSYMFGPGVVGLSGQDVGISFKASDGNTYRGCVWQNGGNYSMYIANPPTGTVTVAAGTAYTPILPNMSNGCILIQAGRNNYASPSQVQSDVAAMVNTAKAITNCYGVMDILNDSAEPSGSSNYNTIIGLNQSFATSYGSHYIADRENLVNDYNPSDPRDVIDHTNDVPATSLRAQDVTGSLSAAITSTSTCAISFGTTVGIGFTVVIGAENIYISGGSDGAYTCTRGYASTTAATYSSGTSWVAIDPLHLGNNQYTPSNPNCGTNGYLCMASAVQASLPVFNSPSPLTNLGSIQGLMAKTAQNGAPITASSYSLSGVPGQLQNSSGNWWFNTTASIFMPVLYIYNGSSIGWALQQAGMSDQAGGSVIRAGDGSWQFSQRLISASAQDQGEAAYPWGTIYAKNAYKICPSSTYCGTIQLNGTVSGGPTFNVAPAVTSTSVVPLSSPPGGTCVGYIDSNGVQQPCSGVGGTTTKTWNAFINSLITINYVSTFVSGESATLTRLIFTMQNGISGCTTQPTVFLYDNTASTTLATVTVANSTAVNDSGALSVAMTAGDTFSIRMTGGSGCTGTTNVYGNVVAEYKN